MRCLNVVWMVAKKLLNFVDHQPAATVEIGNHGLIRDEP
jgi:hypothetical protein